MPHTFAHTTLTRYELEERCARCGRPRGSRCFATDRCPAFNGWGDSSFEPNGWAA